MKYIRIMLTIPIGSDDGIKGTVDFLKGIRDLYIPDDVKATMDVVEK